MTFLYHFTDKKNFENIVSIGGLLSKNAIQNNNIRHIDIAHRGLQERRAEKEVPVSPGGVLHDYVPFYFAPRSPMLYAIKMRNVESYAGEQREIIYLRTTVSAIVDKGLRFVFTDGHPIEAFSYFFNHLSAINKIDRRLMENEFWYNTNDDNDRKRRRQAEFLVKDSFPFNLVEEIGVFDQETKSEVEKVVFRSNYDKIVTVRKDWYF